MEKEWDLCKSRSVCFDSNPSGILQTQLGNANDITHGFSGAPVINGFGNVIGMVSDIPKRMRIID